MLPLWTGWSICPLLFTTFPIIIFIINPFHQSLFFFLLFWNFSKNKSKFVIRHGGQPRKAKTRCAWNKTIVSMSFLVTYWVFKYCRCQETFVSELYQWTSCPKLDELAVGVHHIYEFSMLTKFAAIFTMFCKVLDFQFWNVFLIFFYTPAAETYTSLNRFSH